MRFKHFICEDENSIDEWLKKIKTMCGPYLSISKKHALYRGIADVELPKISRHPLNREAVNSTASYQAFYNKFCEKATGFPAVRSHSYFVTPDIGVTNSFGDVQLVFPVGNFQYLWLNHIKDSLEDNQLIFQQIINGINLTKIKNLKSYCVTQDVENLITDLYREFKCFDINKFDLKKSDKLIYEYMIQQLHEDDEFDNSREGFLTKIFFEITTEVFDKMAHTALLSKGIESNAEILIYKSDGYITIPLAMIHKLFGRTFTYDALLEKIKSM